MLNAVHVKPEVTGHDGTIVSVYILSIETLGTYNVGIRVSLGIFLFGFGFFQLSVHVSVFV